MCTGGLRGNAGGGVIGEGCGRSAAGHASLVREASEEGFGLALIKTEY